MIRHIIRRIRILIYLPALFRIGMKLPIDDEVMRKQPGVVAATTPAGGVPPLPAHVPSVSAARDRSASSGAASAPASSSPAPTAPPVAQIPIDSNTSADDIQKEIEKELADS